MLSRAAEAMYWMARYVERAEQTARLVDVALGLRTDLSDLEPEAAETHLQGTFRILGQSLIPPADGLPAAERVRGLICDEWSPDSIYACVARARENARSVREIISSEMWEHVNRWYWSLREAGKEGLREERAAEFLASVRNGAFLFGGITDGTMTRGEGWHFAKAGQFLERAEQACRTVAVKIALLLERGPRPAGAVDTILWMSLLRSCSALEAYRKVYVTRVEPALVVDFLVLEAEFPRSVRHAVAVTADAVRRIGGEAPEGDRALPGRLLGRLSARLEYAEVPEIFHAGVGPYLERIERDLREASAAIQNAYFLH